MITNALRRPRWMLWLAATALACDAGSSKAPKVALGQENADSARAAAGVQTAPTLGPDAKVALDSGNALFRKKAYPAALAQYRLAAARAPRHAAPFFGIYMVAQATANKVLADSALANIRANNATAPASGFDHSDTSLSKVRASGKKGPIS